MRQSRAWGLSHSYFRTKQVREAPLDPAKQYIITYHPHGVLVLSRIFFYGASFTLPQNKALSQTDRQH